MSEPVADPLAALLPPLLRSMEALGFIARHFHPPDFGAVMDAVGSPDQDLRAARAATETPSDQSIAVRRHLLIATDAALSAFDGLRKAPGEADGARAVFRALRYVP